MTLLQTKTDELSSTTHDEQLATPDVTTIQVVAVVQAFIGLLVAFGAPVSHEQEQAIIGLCTALAVALPIADAIIRNGRARGGATRR
jgi:drug/metabolite transporter (DMT)-like permease